MTIEEMNEKIEEFDEEDRNILSALEFLYKPDNEKKKQFVEEISHGVWNLFKDITDPSDAAILFSDDAFAAKEPELFLEFLAWDGKGGLTPYGLVCSCD